MLHLHWNVRLVIQRDIYSHCVRIIFVCQHLPVLERGFLSWIIDVLERNLVLENNPLLCVALLDLNNQVLELVFNRHLNCLVEDCIGTGFSLCGMT
jgi:hypothetical protein